MDVRRRDGSLRPMEKEDLSILKALPRGPARVDDSRRERTALGIAYTILSEHGGRVSGDAADRLAATLKPRLVELVESDLLRRQNTKHGVVYERTPKAAEASAELTDAKSPVKQMP